MKLVAKFCQFGVPREHTPCPTRADTSDPSNGTPLERNIKNYTESNTSANRADRIWVFNFRRFGVLPRGTQCPTSKDTGGLSNRTPLERNIKNLEESNTSASRAGRG